MSPIKIKIKNKEIEAIYLKGFNKYRGLMFRKKGNALIELKKEQRCKIWMLFVFYPLDLIFLNKEKKVVDIFREAKPLSLNPKTWRTYTSKKKFKYLLELDSRAHLDRFFNIGDVLEWRLY